MPFDPQSPHSPRATRTLAGAPSRIRHFATALIAMASLSGCLGNKDRESLEGGDRPPNGTAASASASTHAQVSASAPAPVPERPGAARPSILGTDSVRGLAALLDTLCARARRGDTVGLVRLMADDSAYRKHVYPRSPVFDSSREEVFRFALTMHKANNAKGLARMLRKVRENPDLAAAAPQPLDSIVIPGGALYRTRSSDSLRLFSEALRQGPWIRVVSYSGALSKAAGERSGLAGTGSKETF